jgi:potassium efflux system protein
MLELKIERRLLALSIPAIIVLMPLAVVLAQNTDNTQGTSMALIISGQADLMLNLEKLRDKRASVENITDLEASVKKNILTHLDQAIRFQELADKFDREAEELSKIIVEAPNRLKQIESELEMPLPSVESIERMILGMQTLELEQRLREEEAELANAKSALANWNDQVGRQETLLQQLPEQIAQAKRRLQDIQKQLDTPPPPDENPLLTEARTAALKGEQAKTQVEIRLHNQQLAGHDILASLLTAERDLAARQVAQVDARLRVCQIQLQERRQQEATRKRTVAEKAKKEAPELIPVVQEQYDINIKLGKQLEKLTREEARLVQTLGNLQAQWKELEEEVVIARDRVGNVALTEAIGLALREQRRLLPSVDAYRTDSKERQLRMSEINEAQIELDRKRRELTNIEPLISEVVGSASFLSRDETEKLASEMRNLLIDQRELVEKLQNGYTRAFKVLRNMEFTEQQLVNKANEYAEFLDRHLLWIRSSKPINMNDLANTGVALGWFSNTNSWRQFLQDVKTSFRRNLSIWSLGLLLAGVLLSGRRWARRELSRIAATVGHQQEDSFSLTLGALALTVYMAVGWPFLMSFIAVQLQRLPLPYLFTRGIASGLLTAAAMLVVLTFFQHLFRPDGLAQIHFGWSEAARRTLRRNLSWFIPVSVISNSLFSIMETTKQLEFSESLSKLAFMILGICLLIFLARILRFSGGIVSALIAHHPKWWLTRLRYVWYPLAVGLPVFFVILVISGFYYSAMEVRNLIRLTILLALILIVFRGLALRWLTLARQSIAIKEAKQRRGMEEGATISPETGGLDSRADGSQLTVQKPEINLFQINEQTRTLLRTMLLILALVGLWAIWNPVLPALGVLQEIQLWSYSSEVEGVIKAIPITLGDLVIAIIVAITTVVAARNLPGLLEIVLLNQLPMAVGARYAVTTICRYAIIALGVILAFSTIGIKWSSIQWLIAALGVGLGFGLQEIVANFICGLIILFERPFRLGDTLTIGDITGSVSRIRIRATTIVDWDRKELIVPNKEFITGRLINWSLSDRVIRIKIPVGIAYGSDTELTETLMLKAARGNPLVLNNPEPSAVFLGFGDNSLNFELRVFINGIDDYIPMLHTLNQAIDSEFRKAGITISFPQRDIHLDATGPLEVKVVSGYADSKSSVPKRGSKKNRT